MHCSPAPSSEGCAHRRESFLGCKSSRARRRYRILPALTQTVVSVANQRAQSKQNTIESSRSSLTSFLSDSASVAWQEWQINAASILAGFLGSSPKTKFSDARATVGRKSQESSAIFVVAAKTTTFAVVLTGVDDAEKRLWIGWMVGRTELVPSGCKGKGFAKARR